MTDAKASTVQWRDEESDNWDLPSRAVVACDGDGNGAVLWTVGPHVAYEIKECGLVDLADLGLDSAPPGISIWDGVYVDESVPPSHPEDDDRETIPRGEFRPPLPGEWVAIKAGCCPWKDQR